MTSSVHHVFLGDEDLGIFDEEKFSTSDADLIMNVTGGRGKGGLTAGQFFQGLQDVDGLAFRALVWLLRYKQGQQVHISTIDFPLAALRLEDEADPTRESSGSGDATTSEPSLNSAI